MSKEKLAEDLLASIQIYTNEARIRATKADHAGKIYIANALSGKQNKPLDKDRAYQFCRDIVALIESNQDNLEILSSLKQIAQDNAAQAIHGIINHMGQTNSERRYSDKKLLEVLENFIANVPEAKNAFIQDCLDKPSPIKTRVFNKLLEKTPNFADNFIENADLKYLKRLQAIRPELRKDSSRTFQTLIASKEKTAFIDAVRRSDLTYIKQTTILSVDDKSPLKYVIDQENTELAAGMAKAGFAIRPEEVDKKILDTIKNSNKGIFFSKSDHLTENDKLRITIAALAKGDTKGVDLSKKPSPLFLALETGQTDWALKLIESGQVLKRSEIAKYSEQDKGSGRFTIDTESRSKSIRDKLVEGSLKTVDSYKTTKKSSQGQQLG